MGLQSNFVKAVARIFFSPMPPLSFLPVVSGPTVYVGVFSLLHLRFQSPPVPPFCSPYPSHLSVRQEAFPLLVLRFKHFFPDVLNTPFPIFPVHSIPLLTPPTTDVSRLLRNFLSLYRGVLLPRLLQFSTSYFTAPPDFHFPGQQARFLPFPSGLQ